jgi:uncharacterized protein (TIGR03000 family)
MTCRSICRWAGVAGLLLALAAPALWAQDRSARMAPAVLIVRVRPDAQLQVDGLPTRQTGENRRFVTPPLEPGKTFSYTLAAVWEPNNYTTITRTRKVNVEAGKESTVDLREADPRQPDNIVIRYVPTPPDVVEAMLKLANVGKDDVVYDLGCGDGRIVIAAVSKFGARRGVGVDLDPQRLKECAENARNAGVSDRVEFRKGNVLEIADLSKATVVAIYMSEDVNQRLRPILQKTLKPGARIVTHQFKMGDWKPAKEETVTGRDDGFPYEIFLWKIGPGKGSETTPPRP